MWEPHPTSSRMRQTSDAYSTRAELSQNPKIEFLLVADQQKAVWKKNVHMLNSKRIFIHGLDNSTNPP